MKFGKFTSSLEPETQAPPDHPIVRLSSLWGRHCAVPEGGLVYKVFKFIIPFKEGIIAWEVVWGIGILLMFSSTLNLIALIYFFRVIFNK